MFDLQVKLMQYTFQCNLTDKSKIKSKSKDLDHFAKVLFILKVFFHKHTLNNIFKTLVGNVTLRLMFLLEVGICWIP